MALFSSRPVGYKIGLLFLLLGTLLYVTGFSAPFWGIYTMSAVSISAHPMTCHEGMWQSLHSDVNEPCFFWLDESEDRFSEGWMKAVRSLQCICLVGVFGACGYAIAINLLQRRDPRLLETTTAVSCLLGFAGGVIYLTKLGDSLHSIHEARGAWRLDKYHYSWALGLDLAGCAVLLIASTVLYIYNESPREAEPSVGFSGPPDEGADHSRVYCVPAQPVLPPAYYPDLPPSYYPESCSPAEMYPGAAPSEYHPGSATPVVYPGFSDPAYEDDLPPEYVREIGDDKARLV